MVSTVSTTPTNLAWAFNGGSLSFSWPADHIGWRLIEQTNHLELGVSTNMSDWATVTNSATTNQVAIPMNATKPGDYFRLVYP